MSINRLIRNKIVNLFKPQIRSRHPSHEPLRQVLTKLPFKSVVRFGSLTEMADTIANGGTRIELNTVDSITNSSNKLLMKRQFTRAAVPTADWGYFIRNWRDGNVVTMNVVTKDPEDQAFILENELDQEQLVFPIVVKHIFGSRGTGNTLINNKEELTGWLVGKEVDKYIFEAYFTGSREYRLHISKDGCFYTNRKMLKTGTPEQDRWYRNDSNSVWILEDNPSFEKPVNWAAVVDSCVEALHAVGLDMGAIDLRIQSSKDSRGRVRENPEYKIIEINSAPSMGAITLEKYTALIPNLLKDKYNGLHPVL